MSNTDSHSPFQIILFYGNPQDDVQGLKLNIMTFGANYAPYLAIRTIHQLADGCEADNPFVSEAMRNQKYVDDILAGSHSFAETTLILVR